MVDFFDGPTPANRLFRYVRRMRRSRPGPHFWPHGEGRRRPDRGFAFNSHLAIGTRDQFTPVLGQPSQRDLRSRTLCAVAAGDLLDEVRKLTGLGGDDFPWVRGPWLEGLHQLLMGLPNDVVVMVAVFAGHESLASRTACPVTLRDQFVPGHPKVEADDRKPCPLFSPSRGKSRPGPRIHFRFDRHLSYADGLTPPKELVLVGREWTRVISRGGRAVFPVVLKRSVGFVPAQEFASMAGPGYHSYDPFRDAPGSKSFGEVAQLTVVVVRPFETDTRDRDGFPTHAWADHWNLAVSRKTGRLIDTTLHLAEYNSLVLYFPQLAERLPPELAPRLRPEFQDPT